MSIEQNILGLAVVILVIAFGLWLDMALEDWSNKVAARKVEELKVAQQEADRIVQIRLGTSK